MGEKGLNASVDNRLTIAQAMEGVSHVSVQRETPRMLFYVSPNAERVIRFHRDDILRFHLDGSVTINVGEYPLSHIHEHIGSMLKKHGTGAQRELAVVWTHRRGRFLAPMESLRPSSGVALPLRRQAAALGRRLCHGGREVVSFMKNIRVVPMERGVLVLSVDSELTAPFVRWCMARACYTDANVMGGAPPITPAKVAGNLGGEKV